MHRETPFKVIRGGKNWAPHTAARREMGWVSIFPVGLGVSYLTSLSFRSFLCKERRRRLTWELCKDPRRS